ncbi:hypothetical protein J2S30_002579 [Herbaspirillum rubrisubalbicans]|nr:hypothetical protein [Herbaspirillum rubrisubalbicans]
MHQLRARSGIGPDFFQLLAHDQIALAFFSHALEDGLAFLGLVKFGVALLDFGSALDQVGHVVRKEFQQRIVGGHPQCQCPRHVDHDVFTPFLGQRKPLGLLFLKNLVSLIHRPELPQHH